MRWACMKISFYYGQAANWCTMWADSLVIWFSWGFESFIWGHAIHTFFSLHSVHKTPPGFYTMRSKCSPHCIHTTIYIIVGNLNNSTIFTYLWLTRSLASMARKTLERLIFCHFRPLTLNSTRMCFYHVLKRISTSLSQVVFQAISNLIKNWKK